MTELQSIIENFKSDLKKLRILLIILTLIQIGYMIIIFADTKLWIKLDFNYKANWLIWGLNLILAGIFIWFNWTRMPIKKKTKIYNTFLILFLGIIGMWLWIPNKSEISKLSE
jgi:cell division protein FtsW (lipid II flippase)